MTPLTPSQRYNLDNMYSLYYKSKDRFNLFIRSISTISITLLGLLISLKDKTEIDLVANRFFLVSIILLALTVFFTLIVQFLEGDKLNKAFQEQKEGLQSSESNKDLNSIQVTLVDKSKSSKFFEIGTYIFLILSITSLIFYSYHAYPVI
ncbi:hypothetical protein [Acidiluteibacter ferrifornacis]|uniref:Uncharacterized protein n=1 Tax=Acidiluteibacter ferrifornacis TaxID=2692424 RepID=A0A6N9NIS7_9FLAO|nr:hypothetical protein [Acidiluteibacter ferrifornacis]NBG65401.1 hypothetical protein [Acidiluteibacter ferrifornacis]